MNKDPRWTPAWRRLRIQCYERDKARGAVCVHCGQPINYNVKQSSTDDSYEPDHRIDVAKHPELTSGKKETQKKSDTPIRVLWKKRDNTIRQRKSRHKYSDAEFEAAKEYIMDCYEQAQTDFDYAAEQYEKDMELTAIDEYVRRVTDV